MFGLSIEVHEIGFRRSHYFVDGFFPKFMKLEFLPRVLAASLQVLLVCFADITGFL